MNVIPEISATAPDAELKQIADRVGYMSGIGIVSSVVLFLLELARRVAVIEKEVFTAK